MGSPHQEIISPHRNFIFWHRKMIFRTVKTLKTLFEMAKTGFFAHPRADAGGWAVKQQQLV